MREVAIVAAVRTAVARENGALRDLPPHRYGAGVIKAAVERARCDPNEIEDVIFGNVQSRGGNIARLCALEAGLPVDVPGLTVDRQCGSALEAINTAASRIMAGAGEVFVAGGVESMTRAPYILERPASAYSRVPPKFLRPQLSPEQIGNPEMGITAENVAERFSISREEQDAFAFRSQQLAAAALAEGRFREQIVPVQVPSGKESVTFAVDEHPRLDTTLERLAKLPPAFKPGGTVTAGSSSGINDGASAAVLMEAGLARARGLEILGFVRAWAVAGVDPNVMGIGPVPAVRKLLQRTGMSLDQIGLVELNEAFAAQALACIRELGLEMARVNVNGGAIALGHPLGATGGILTAKLLYEMKRTSTRFGMVTACIGGGQGIATLFERP
ncbi:MAG: thiolase family protein [Bacillota bacterium]